MKSTLAQRFWVKVDTTGDCWLWIGSRDVNGYGRIKAGRPSPSLAHRVAYELSVGEILDGMEIDHRCHNRSCVNPSHLRLATSKQNKENLLGARANSKSGVRGVSWHEGARKWRVYVGHKYVGLFESLDEAREVARLKRIELFTHNDEDRVLT